MKLSLRNLALCGSLMLAGAAMAQTPTVKLDWTKSFGAPDAVYNEARYGTGFGDKIYWMNKAEKKVMVYDHATDAVSVLAELPGTCGVGLTTDDAGNVLVSGSWAGKDGTNYYIITPEGEVTPLEVTLDSEVAAGRMDFLGRVAGNLMENAIFYIFQNGNNKVQMINVTEGKQNLDEFSFFSSATLPIAGGTNAICNPLYSFEELMDMGDDAVNGAAVRQRANKFVYTCDGAEWNALPAPANITTNDAFDVFTLGEVDYQIIPTSKTGKYNSGFSICDFQGNVIYSDYDADRELLNGAEGYTNGSSIIAHKINDNTVEIYTWYPMNPTHHAAKFTVSLPAEPAAPLYVCGAGNGLAWEPATPMVVNPEADGSYKFTISNLTSMKISSVAGSWDDFNTAALFFVPTAENLGQEIPVEINGATNIDMPWTGDWTITISADKTKAVCTTTTPQPIGAPDVYLRGAVNGWNAPGIDNWKFECNSQTEDQYIYMFYCGNDKGTMLPTTSFKIADANWGQINYSANKKIAAAEMVATNQIVMQYNANDMSVAVPFQGTLEFRLNKDLANKNGVVLIFHPGENLTTAVEAIEVEEGEAVYYNLQGVKVVNPENGMYLKVVNGKASKVLVK